MTEGTVSATGCQLEDVNSLGREIDGIAHDARRTASEAAQGAAGNPVALSYSLESFSSPESTVAAIVDSIREALLKLAPVATFETSREGFTARTVINYSGRAVSVWCVDLSSELVNAHLSSLQRAYLFRAAVAGVIASVGNALVSISIAVANPLTVLQALRSAEALKRAVERLAAAVALAA